MKGWRFTILIPAFALFLSGCGSTGSSRSNSTSPPGEHEQKVPLAQFEKAFNPSDYDDEIEEVQKQHVLEEQKTAAAAHQEDSVVVESEYAQGYRIQIFATGNIDEANAMRMTALQHITDDSLYVVFDPPVYKVRVGDFRTKTEAKQKLGEVAGFGFADAWVVSDRIIQRKLVRIQSTNAPRRQ